MRTSTASVLLFSLVLITASRLNCGFTVGPARSLRPSAVGARPRPSTARRTVPTAVITVGEAPDMTRAAAPGNNHDKVVASAVLVAGNMIGAGVLALPAVSLPLGFGPAAGVLTAAWAGCVATGLLIAEVMINFRDQSDGESPSIMAMAERTLGPVGGVVSCGSLVMLNYALMCAYISKVGEVLHAGGAAAGLEAADPATMGVGYTAALGLTLGAGAAGSGLFEGVNNAMMVILVASFTFMIAALAPGVDAGLLAHHDLSALPHAVPVLICALVFQNIVPTIVSDLDGDASKVRTSILAGSAIPLAMYFVFNAAFLGSIAPDEALSAAAVGERISAAMGDGLSSLVFPAFSFAAVTSSCTGTARSQLEEFSSLLSDAAGRSGTGTGVAEALKPLLPLAVCAPPLAVSLTNPGCFETALELAGSFGNLVLFGLVPVAMAWSQRDALEGVGAATDAVAADAHSHAKVSAAHFAAFGLNEEGAPAALTAAATPTPAGAGAAEPSFETYLAFHPFDVEPPARASIMAGVRGVRANAAKASRSLALANDRTSGVTRTDYADEFGDVGTPLRTTQLLPGGKPVLGAIGGVSGGLVISELLHMASASAL
mmetsp:Transcript_29681/g.68877  ORF Transcript_29681/g.68877 Transcript_29681/m.68877 type:complete len:602 (-) Transcript_29681:47-1852(-)